MSLTENFNILKRKVLYGNLHLGGFDGFIHDRITQVFPKTIPPKITHSLFVSLENICRHINVYPEELPGNETEDVKKAHYDLGAETINYWLLNEACGMVLSDLYPGVSHGLKGLSAIYQLDSNPGHKELGRMKKKLKITNLRPIISDTLFSHDPSRITDLWNIYRRAEDTTRPSLTPENFILDIGRLACPDTDIKKIQSKMQQPTPNWIGDIEAVAQSPGYMLKPEWLNFITLAESVGGAAMLSVQPVFATILLGRSAFNAGLSIIDEIYKNIYMRSLSETDFGIRKIKWKENNLSNK